jgi:tetratricopeptide (TPR) repeat protein
VIELFRSLGDSQNLFSHLALAYILWREFPRAEATLETVIQRERQPGDFFERQAARVWGELAQAQGEATRALHIAEQLIVSAPGEMRQQPIPHLLALKGEALIALKRQEQAVESLEEAKLGAELRQAPSILWRIHRSLGRVYHLLKRADAAQREWEAAREIITRLAGTIDQTPLYERFVQAALQTIPSDKPLSSRRTTIEHDLA